MQALLEHKNRVDAFGYTCVKHVYDRQDIDQIAKHFDQDFLERLKNGQVQSRDYKRYACKLPICDEYLPILNNSTVHKLLSMILGEDYVLFNFNSHSSLPGSSSQLMHVDTVDPRNGPAYVNAQTNVVFLHIPMLDTQKEHGATGIWPATLFRQTNSINDSDTYQWVKDNLPQSTAQLERGDVILKRDNCVHAGGANRSEVRRHMITLIFARKNYYLTYNSGMIPCMDYSKVLSQKLPYKIASDAALPQLSHKIFKAEQIRKIEPQLSALKHQINFLQHYHISNAIEANITTRLKPAVLDENLLLNIVQALKPSLNAAFNAGNYRLHSVKQLDSAREFACDDQSFKESVNENTINDKNNLLTLHIALDDSDFSVYAGNKVLSKAVLLDSDCHKEQIKHYKLKAGDILITTGSLVYAKHDKAQVLRICFTQDYYLPSYDDRFYVTDEYFLSLPNSLSPLIRYDNIFITQEKYQHFQYNRRTHFAYIVLNTIGNLRVKNKLLGTLAGMVTITALAPVGLYFLIRRTKNKAKQTLETY